MGIMPIFHDVLIGYISCTFGGGNSFSVSSGSASTISTSQGNVAFQSVPRLVSSLLKNNDKSNTCSFQCAVCSISLKMAAT